MRNPSPTPLVDTFACCLVVLFNVAVLAIVGRLLSSSSQQQQLQPQPPQLMMADSQHIEPPAGSIDVEAAVASATPPDNSGIQQKQPASAAPFQPIYTLVNNTSTRTTHHPHVKYIFSDDDPDEFMQALAQQNHANLGESASGPAPDHRAILLDLTPNPSDGTLNVSWASSLSPSWAVLDAQVSRISPPSSDGGGGRGGGGGGGGGSDPTASPTRKKPDRLMLRIEGIDGGSLASDSELRLSDDKSRLGSSGSASGGSGQRAAETEDYNVLVDEFDKRMSLLRKVVDAGEERRRKVAEGTGPGANVQLEEAPNETVPTSTENLRRSVDSG